MLIVEWIKKLAAETIGQTQMYELPKVIVQNSSPPCINELYNDAATAHHLSHIGRFTLTSFMVKIGMSPEAVNKMFKTFSDYNERLTRYQIEHIAGERGSVTRYICRSVRFYKHTAYAETKMTYAALSTILSDTFRRNKSYKIQYEHAVKVY